MNDGSTEIHSEPTVAETATIGPEVTLGRGVIVRMGATVAGRVEIGDGCEIGPGAVLDAGADPAGAPLVLEGDVHVMAGATIAAGITISRGARVSAGTVVRDPVPPHAIVDGNPAQIVGYTHAPELDASRPDAEGAQATGVRESRVAGVTLHHLPRILDLRGNLTVGEFGRSIPFEAKRYFMVFGVPNAEIRGEHAHRTCKQFLICARGTCSVVADDGVSREEFLLDDPATGLYLPALTWGVQYKYSADAVLLVFASEFYDSAEYIRDYAEFTSLTAARS